MPIKHVHPQILITVMHTDIYVIPTSVCVCVCVRACEHVYVVYEDTNLYNDMGMT